MTMASPQPRGVEKAQGHTSDVPERGLQGPGMSFNQSSRYLPLRLLEQITGAGPELGWKDENPVYYSLAGGALSAP